ncbi:MAG: hypothetical protein HWN79_06795 [Candidatus Lokiarchaeota archaeon]|nr:hypothetical protein [Candidatus Lokiarchaeota archaeon]
MSPLAKHFIEQKYKGKYKVSADLEDPQDMKEGELYRFSAAIDDEIHTEGAPNHVIGRLIIAIWSDAVEITKAHFRKIKQEKKLVEKILNEKPRLWINGYGSC